MNRILKAGAVLVGISAAGSIVSITWASWGAGAPYGGGCCPKIFDPFNPEDGHAVLKDGICTVTLPEKCFYAIVQFE